MTAPSLFDTPTESPTSPEQSAPAEVQPVEPAPVLDWQEQPERFTADGKPRPRFVWPTNYSTKQARNMGRKLDEYREKKQNDKLPLVDEIIDFFCGFFGLGRMINVNLRSFFEGRRAVALQNFRRVHGS